MRQYVVDAFTDKVFCGNPAAIVVLDEMLSDELLQKITIENNLSETAFLVKTGEAHYKLRWFTPGGEIDLCGHATLASAYALTRFYEPGQNCLKFDTQSGELTVTKKGDLFEMDFPEYDIKPVEITEEMTEAFGKKPIAAYGARDLVLVFDDEEFVRSYTPNVDKIKALPFLGVDITAAGKDYDCVSRSFFPKMNVVEDPVCGSGHCHIIPYWAKVTGKKEFKAYQASRRGGELFAEVCGERIKLSGKAVLFSTDDINIE